MEWLRLSGALGRRYGILKIVERVNYEASGLSS